MYEIIQIVYSILTVTITYASSIGGVHVCYIWPSEPDITYIYIARSHNRRYPSVELLWVRKGILKIDLKITEKNKGTYGKN